MSETVQNLQRDIKGAATTSEVREALQGPLTREASSSRHFWDLAALHAPVLDGPLLADIFKNASHPELLLDNSSFTAEHAESIWTLALKSTTERQLGLFLPFARKGLLNKRSEAYTTLISLISAGQTGTMNATRILAARPDASIQDLRDLALAAKSTLAQNTLAMEQDLPLEIYRFILQEVKPSGGKQMLLMHVLYHEVTRLDPICRAIAFEQLNTLFIPTLVPDASPDELRQLLDYSLARNQHIVTEAILEEAPSASLAALEDDEWLQLLTHENSEIRLAAMRTSARRGAPINQIAPEGQKRSR